MKPDPEEEPYSDEIRREEGLERYWLFYNGEWAETIFGLAAAGGGIFWCFLWLLGYSQTLIGYVLGAIAILGFCCWYLLFRLIWQYEQRGWRRRGKSSASSEKKNSISHSDSCYSSYCSSEHSFFPMEDLGLGGSELGNVVALDTSF